MELFPAECAKEFDRLARKTALRPTEDHVHDLRVLTRRLRADLWLVPKSRRTRRMKKARRDLKQLASVLGEQRKYDVALEDATHYHRGTKKIKSCLKTARKNVKRALLKQKRKSYSLEIKKAVRDMNRLSAASFVPHILAVKRSLGSASRRPPRTANARHHLRIEIKKARYILDTLNNDVPSLNRLQEHLGRWHDLVVLSGLSRADKSLSIAREREWNTAEHLLKPTIRQTTRSLDALAKKLSA